MILDHWQTVLAQAAAATNLGAPAAGQPTQTQDDPRKGMMQFVVFMAIAMFLLVFVSKRSQGKTAKQHASMLDKMKTGDKIVTSSGIVGTVVAVKDRTVSLRSAETKLEVLKSAVTEITEASGDANAGESQASRS